MCNIYEIIFIFNIMSNKIIEISIKEKLLAYEGANNQILDWKRKIQLSNKYVLTRTQIDYLKKFYDVKPKIVRRRLKIVDSFFQRLIKDNGIFLVEDNSIWVEKLLCETDKAYHIYGKILEKQELHPIWLPKTAIIPEEKKLNKVIDYSKYSHRPPLEHQKVAIEKLLVNDRFILADDMGLGKSTSAVIASIESEAKKVLIVCPSSLKINWKREIEYYSKDHILIVDGKKWGSTFKYYIINYDIVKNFHTTNKSEDSNDYKLIINEKFDVAIIDEAHMISNSSARRTKLLNDILDKIPKVWLLTGTPMTSRPINFYNILKIVNSPITSNWQTYVKRYCGGYQFTVNNRKIWNVNGATNLDELREVTKNLVLRRLKTDILDLPEKIINPIYLELNNTLYNEELDEFIKITKEEKTIDKLSLSFNILMKIRQIIANEKITYTTELIDKYLELDKKIIVFTNFTLPLDTLYEKYKKISVILDGRMSKDKRQYSVDKFQNDDKIKLFIANIKSGGVGITLTKAEVVIMNDLSFVPSDHSQAEDRSYRYGQKNSVLIYYPIFENTIEMNVYNILQRKKSIIETVMGDNEYSESFMKEFLSSIN